MSDYSNRNLSDSSEKMNNNKKSTDYQKEVRDLLTSGHKLNPNTIFKLRNKYGDQQTVDKIIDEYKHQLHKISKHALKFKNIFLQRYTDIAPEKLYRKAHEFLKKNNFPLEGDLFNMFMRIVLNETDVMHMRQSIPNNKMAKLLGYDEVWTAQSMYGSSLNVDASELTVVNNIIELYNQTRQLFWQCTLQTLGYEDCSLDCIISSCTGDECRRDPYSYIHPVIVALFTPKFVSIEKAILLSNIGNIVHRKNQQMAIDTLPDYELYWSLITDPNDRICNKESPIKDLYNRYLLQTTLWKLVSSLRTGKYYTPDTALFSSVVDACKDSIFDAPDMTYIKDEGKILRKIFGAHGIRPTTVSTTRILNFYANGQYISTSNMGPVSSYYQPSYYNQNYAKLTQIPMITLRLPMKQSTNSNVVALRFTDSLSQPQFYIENKTVIPTQQSIVHSNEIVVFYVNRRFQTLTVGHTPQMAFVNLPVTLSAIEKMNDSPIDFEQEINITGNKFSIRSVVSLHCNSHQVPGSEPINIIVGSCTFVFPPDDSSRRLSVADIGDNVLVYHPIQNFTRFGTNGDPQTSSPFKQMTRNNADSVIRTNGTIFIYQSSTATAPYQPPNNGYSGFVSTR